MYVTKGGGGGKRDFEKKTIVSRNMNAISNKHWGMQIRNGMGYVSKKTTREIIVLCRGGGGGVCNSIKNGTKRYAGMLLRKIETVFGCINTGTVYMFPINSNNLLIRPVFKCIFLQLESFDRSCSVHVIYSNASAIAHD